MNQRTHMASPAAGMLVWVSCVSRLGIVDRQKAHKRWVVQLGPDGPFTGYPTRFLYHPLPGEKIEGVHEGNPA